MATSDEAAWTTGVFNLAAASLGRQGRRTKNIRFSTCPGVLLTLLGSWLWPPRIASVAQIGPHGEQAMPSARPGPAGNLAAPHPYRDPPSAEHALGGASPTTATCGRPPRRWLFVPVGPPRAPDTAVEIRPEAAQLGLEHRPWRADRGSTGPVAPDPPDRWLQPGSCGQLV